MAGLIANGTPPSGPRARRTKSTGSARARARRTCAASGGPNRARTTTSTSASASALLSDLVHPALLSRWESNRRPDRAVSTESLCPCKLRVPMSLFRVWISLLGVGRRGPVFGAYSPRSPAYFLRSELPPFPALRPWGRGLRTYVPSLRTDAPSFRTTTRVFAQSPLWQKPPGWIQMSFELWSERWEAKSTSSENAE